MQLDFAVYRDKVMGCWAGKNIGGVLGAPFEGKRQYNDLAFYAQDLSAGPPPNDDLDLQIIWLTAVERFGRSVNASILAEYWLSYVIPNWVEYGTGKANLTAGLAPPLSGHVLNQYRQSCGCFIRSEIWACLAPGLPDIAARYAYEDGIVDHSGEGVYGEVFCAALESAAFVVSDTRTLIDIGLSYIPKDCAVARCVRKAAACYDNGMTLPEARIAIHNEAPGTFGLMGVTVADIPTENGQMAVGTPGFDAPENIGFLIAGWLYGEGDFGRSLCAAVACGEDTDCTAATLGAILGIVSGASRLPEKWTAPLNDKIKTMCINLTTWKGVWVPDTVTELTDRVLRITPLFLGLDYCDILAGVSSGADSGVGSGANSGVNSGVDSGVSSGAKSGVGYTINCYEATAMHCKKNEHLKGHMNDYWPRTLPVDELIALRPHVVRHVFATHTVMVDYGEDCYFDADRERTITIRILNHNLMYQQLWCTVRLYTPEGVYVSGGAEYTLQLNNLCGDRGECTFTIDPSEFAGGRLEMLADVAFIGRHTDTPVKILLLRRAN